jgi:hypothetical protein
LDFVPFFADFAAFFFAAIFTYIEKGTYISFLIMKIKKINLFWMTVNLLAAFFIPVLIFLSHMLKQGL